MNNELYKNLKEEIKTGISNFDLNVQNIEAMEYVRSLLASKLAEYSDKKDKISVILAFYETTNYEIFSFLRNYYLEVFNSFFATPNLLKQSFEDVLMNITLQNAFFVMASDSLVMSLYEYAKNMSEENLHPKYKSFFDEVKTKCEQKGLINLININNVTEIPNKVIELKQDELNKKQEELDDRKKVLDDFRDYKKETIFTGAANSLGLVQQNDLVNKTIKEGINPLDIDKIVIEDEVIKMLSSEASKVSTVSKKAFTNIILRLKQKNKLRNVCLCLEEEKEITTLNITKKDNEFDKIASCGSEVLVTIRTTIKKIINNSALFIDASVETIKQALRNTSEKVHKIEKAPVEFVVEDMQIKEQVELRKEAESMFPSYLDENVIVNFENPNDLANASNSDINNAKKM